MNVSHSLLPARHAAASWIACGLMLLAAPAGAADALPADARFDAAMAAYERNHWRAAHEALAALADAGHVEAARLAWLMARHGPALYGSDFGPPSARARQWLAAASAGPSPVIASVLPGVTPLLKEQP